MRNFIQSLLLIIISVLVSTTEAEEVTVVYGQLGGAATLQRSSDGFAINRMYVYWHFESLERPRLASKNSFGNVWYSEDPELATRLSLIDSSLTIRNIQEKDFGTYFCQQSMGKSTPKLSKYKLCKLSVSVSPNSSVLVGESVRLACNVDTPEGHAKPQIHWLNAQTKTIAAEDRGEITVRASGQDHGEWTCVVTSNNMQTKAKVSVQVIDLSPAPPHPLYTSISLPLSIPCSIPPHVSWDQLKAKGIQGGHWRFTSKPGSSLTPGDSLFSLSLEASPTWKADQDRGLGCGVLDPSKNNLSLYRSQAKEADRGEYVCSLEFKGGLGLTRTVHVEVLQILSSPGTELISGQELNLTCSLGYALTSDLEVKWIPPKTLLTPPPLGNAPHPAHLTIPEVGLGHNGKWSCELWQSKTRLTYAVIELQIEPKLSAWMLVTISGASVIFILLLVLAVIFIRRHRQRRMRPPRHRFCQCKHPKPVGFYRT